MVRPPTDPGDERAVLQLLEQAIDLDAPGRERFLDERCGRDTELRRRLERLIALHGEGELTQPADMPTVEDVVSRAPRYGPAPGDHVGAWELVEPIGRGGMGEVWRARRADGRFEREVAVKLVAAGLLRDDVVRRFERERQLLARLEHPGIAHLLDGGVEQGVPWIAMELVRGRPIDEHCREHGLDVEARVSLFGEVCAAVQFAHERQVVHRDLKPANVLVRADGRVALLDFGIARLLDGELAGGDLTRPSERMLTPRYAAPEQVAGEPPTAATDVYALGVLLYELLTGRHPFEDELDSWHDLRRLAERGEPLPPSQAVLRSGATGAPARAAELRGDLDAIVLQALRSEPARRYRTAQALLDDLERHRAGRPVLARPDTWTYRATKFARRHRIAVGAAAVVLVAVGGAAAWSRHLRGVAASADERAAREQELGELLFAHLEDSLELSHPELVQSRLRRAGREDRIAELERELDAMGMRYADAPAIEGRLRARAAGLLFKLGRVDAAAHQVELARPLLSEALPPEHLDRLRLEALSWDVARLRGDASGAVDGLRTLLDTSRRTSPSDAALELELRTSLLAALQFSDRMREARVELDRLQPLAAQAHGDPSAEVGALRSRLAGVLYALGEVEPAEVEARRALDELIATVGADHLLVAEARRTLARLLLHARELEEADEQLALALPVLEAWAVEDDPLLAWTRVDQARVLQARGRLDESGPLLERAIADLERNLGPRNRILLDARMYRSAQLAGEGDTEGAIEEVRAVIAELRASDELSSSVTLLNSLHALGAWLAQAGRWSEAEEVLRDLAVERERLQGAAHPQTLATLDGLAQSVLGQGRVGEGVEILREVVRRAEADDPGEYWTLKYRARLAFALRAQWRWDEVAAIVREVVPAFRELPGHEDLDEYLTAAAALAAVLEGEGRHAEALELRRELVGIEERRKGALHLDTLGALEAEARCLAVLERHAEAEGVWRELVERSERAGAAEELDRRIGWAESVARGEPPVDDAEDVLIATLELVEERRGGDSPDASFCRALLGSHFLGAGAVDDAGWLLEEAHQQLAQQAGPGDRRTRYAARALARLCRELGDDERAAALEAGG